MTNGSEYVTCPIAKPRTAYPRRVTTGPIRRVRTDGVSLRGSSYNYRLTSGQASYALYAAQQARG